jgi:threonylcarbamoyladenosine tRNA methylthiotransferase MtaB
LYKDRVRAIKEIMPSACIGVDVIVGFPGETDEEFLKTYRFLADLDISYLHVFSYSERPNTEASEMTGVVPQHIRSKRSKMLRGLSVKKRHHFYESQLGSERVVLFEAENKKGYITGFTDNYIKVRMPWDPSLINTLHKASLEHIDEEGYVRINL